MTDAGRESLVGALMGAFGRVFNSLPFGAADGDGLSGRRRESSAFRLIPIEVVLLLVVRLVAGAEGVDFLELGLEVGADAGVTEALGREVVGGREAGFPVSMDERTELRKLMLRD